MQLVESPPSRGAWIEIRMRLPPLPQRPSRTSHGVRGLKFSIQFQCGAERRRTPHGVRGLKWHDVPATFAADGRTPLGCVD